MISKLFRSTIYSLNIIVLLFAIPCNAQLSLTPVLGVDFAKIEDKDEIISFNQLVLTQRDYTAIHPFVGLKIEYKLLKRFFFSVNSNFGIKSVSAFDTGLGVVRGIKFNYVQNSLSINFLFSNRFSIGAGWKHNLMNNFKSFYNSGWPNDHKYKFSDYGPGMNFNYYWKRFNIGAYFYKGLNENIGGWPDFDINILHINSFGVYLGYKFSFPNLFKGKSAANCPTFKR